MGVIIFLLETIVELLFYLLAAAAVVFALNYKKEENFLAKLPPVFKIVVFIILTSWSFGALNFMLDNIGRLGMIFDDYGNYEANIGYIVSCLKGSVVFLVLAAGSFLSFRGLEFSGGDDDEEAEE